jgi:hypothetical protein
MRYRVRIRVRIRIRSRMRRDFGSLSAVVGIADRYFSTRSPILVQVSVGPETNSLLENAAILGTLISITRKNDSLS